MGGERLDALGIIGRKEVFSITPMERVKKEGGGEWGKVE